MAEWDLLYRYKDEPPRLLTSSGLTDAERTVLQRVAMGYFDGLEAGAYFFDWRDPSKLAPLEAVERECGGMASDPTEWQVQRLILGVAPPAQLPEPDRRWRHARDVADAIAREIHSLRNKWGVPCAAGHAGLEDLVEHLSRLNWEHAAGYWDRQMGVLKQAAQSKSEEMPLSTGVDSDILESVAEQAAVKAVEAAAARENDDDQSPPKLPELKTHDRQAWQLATLHGMTQVKVAEELNKEHGTFYTQGQVSRMIARAKTHADRSGLTEKTAGPINRPRTVDPGRLELGARVDKRTPRPSDQARAEDNDE